MTSTRDPNTAWLSDLSLADAVAMMRANGVREILFKVLPRNANSKNQVYLAPDFSQLGKIPSGAVTTHESTSTKSGKQEAIFRAPLDWHWLDANGQPHAAPSAKLIFYPQFPEVRLSGFLLGCRVAPSELWVKERRGEEPGRVLLMGVGNGSRIMALTLPPESPAARELAATGPHESYGVLGILRMGSAPVIDDYLAVMRELCRVHRAGWVPSIRLDPAGNPVPCDASNCHGNTLEAMLGIRSNGFSLPDLHGWELKARLVTSVLTPKFSVVTLFTPEPSAGLYVEQGAQEFVRKYGYEDRTGRVDRLNFGGVYRVHAEPHHLTGLSLAMSGYDPESGSFSPDGAIQLIDRSDRVAAAWPFAKLLDHWKLKHARAAFVPAQCRRGDAREYRFGGTVAVGEGAEFRRLLEAFYAGSVYYDPGIKIEDASSAKPRLKKRSQFRVMSRDLRTLYATFHNVDACAVASSTSAI